MWWLISANVTPLKSCTFNKGFLLSLFFIDSSDDRVSHYNASTSQPSMFNFLSGGLIYCKIFIRYFTSCCFLKKIELLTLLLSVVSYLFLVILVELMRMLAQSSLPLSICCIEHSPQDGSIFSL